MNIKWICAALALLPALVRGERFLLPWSLYYQDGQPVFDDGSVVTPTGSGAITFASDIDYEYSATAPAGHKTTEWRLATQQAVTTAMTLDALNSIDTFEGGSVKFRWVARYANGANAAVQYYYLAPCFSWLNYNLAYRGNYSGINGDWGTTNLVYTNSVTIADASSLWSLTRTGYDIIGWSRTEDGEVQYKAGDVLGISGDAFEVAADDETVYLYAVWGKRDMKIALDAQGGNVASNSVTAHIEEKYSLPTPTREGFVFNGWYTTPAAETTKVVDGVTVVTRDDISTLYAHWTELRFNLSYDWNWNEGTGAAPATQHYGYTDSATLASAPVSWKRTGYDFLGWSTNDATVAQFAPGATLTPAGRYLGIAEGRLEARLLGVWQIRTMTIGLDAGGGTVSAESVTARVGESYSLPTLTREGFMFDGWFTAPLGGEQIADKSIVQRDDISKLYAHWTLITFTISHDWNWENAPANPASAEYGYTNKVRLVAAPTWKRIGYNFDGWAHSATASEPEYAPGAEFEPAGRTFDISAESRAVSLFGVWSKRPMTIVLDAQGGNVASNSVIARIEETYSLPTPTRDGFIFQGWFTALTGGLKISDGDAVVADNITTLYARWKLVEFTIAYNENLPAPAPSRSEYLKCGWTNTLEIAALPAAWTRIGWDFLGWADVATADSPSYSAGQNIPEVGRAFGMTDGATNELFAVWELRKMAISLDAEGNMAYSNDFYACVSDTLAEPPTSIVVTVETSYPLPELVRRDGWFDGWFTAPDGGDMITNCQKVVRDDISALYAHWTPKKIFNVSAEFRDALGAPTHETQTVFEKDYAVMPPLDVVDAWIGHTFLNWQPDTNACIEAHTDFSAVYKTNEYDIVFDANGGQGRMDPIHILYDVETNLTANSFRRGKTDAWKFSGWALDDDPETVVYADGAPVINLTPVDGAKVYLNAVWRDNLTDFSLAADSDIVLSSVTNMWAYTNNLADVAPENETKWHVTNLVNIVSNEVDGVVTTNITTAIAMSSAELFSGRTELRGIVHGKGVLSFEWGANYDTDTYDTDEYIFKAFNTETQEEEIDFRTNGLLRCRVWPTSNNLFKVEMPITNDAMHEVSWSLPFLGIDYLTKLENAFFLRNVQWMPEGRFTVSFDGSTNHLGVAASGEMHDVYFYRGEYGTLPKNLFSIIGYTFDGWDYEEICPVKDEGGNFQSNIVNHVIFADRETTVRMTNDTTLVAQWVANKYSIRFDANGGVGEMADQELVYDAPENIDTNDFSRVGYAFSHWLFGGDEYADCALVTNLTTEAGAVLDFVAQWEANKYTAEFDANGGTGDALAPIPCVYDAPWELPDNPFSRTGYTFVGWELGEDVFAAGETVSNLTVEVDGKVKLLAAWTPNEYDVEFDGGEGACGEMPSVHFIYDTPASLPSNTFERVGYSFAGWSFGGETFADGATVSNLVADADGVAKLVANWRAHSFTVMFDANGGLGAMTPQGFTYDAEAGLAQCAFYRIGYTFAGWACGETVFADGQSVSNLVADDSAEVTLTAIWEPVKYSVEFQGGASDVTGQMQPLALEYDEAAELPRNEFVRIGYTFVQWKNGDQAFADGAVVSNLTDVADSVVTLTAEWKAHGYTVAFLANGGEGEMDSSALAYGDTASLVPNAFTRTGYKFVGWALSEDGDVAYGDGAEISNLAYDDGGAVALYAVWQSIQYVVWFDANGGEGFMEDLALTYDVAANLPPNSFTRSGFNFVGWLFGENAYADGEEILNLTVEEGEELKFVAQWQVEQQEVPVEPEKDGKEESQPVELGGEVFPAGAEEIGEFTATAASTYNGWLRDAQTGRIAALLSVKTTAVKKAGASSRSTIKVTPLVGKKLTYKTAVEPGANPTDEFGIVYGALGLSGKFQGYDVEAALDYTKAKAGTAERAIANLLPTGAWSIAFDTAGGYVTFTVTVSNKGKAKIVGFLDNGKKVSLSAQGILGANNVFAIPVMNSKKGVGFVLWVSEDGSVEISDCINPDWSPVAKAALANLKDGAYALSFSMPTWRSYIAATDMDGVNVTPIGEGIVSVAGGKWSVAKSVGKVAVVKGSVPPQTFVKIKDGLTPVNLASLKLTHTAKTGAVKGSFKLWYIKDGKLRSDKVTVTGAVVAARFFATATVKNLGSFKITIADE